MNPLVSFVIVNWNTPALVSQAIDSIYLFERTIDFEIIVVDNASTDDSVDVLRKAYPNVKVLANSSNQGFAMANNHGVRSAMAKHVILFNSDAYLIEAVLEKCLAQLGRIGNCILSCRILNQDGSIQYSGDTFPSLGGYFLDAFGTTKFIMRKKISVLSGSVGIQKMDWVCGAFMMMETETYRKLGGLNEKIFMYGEDVEFCFRAKGQGVTCRYFPEASVVHIGGGSNHYSTLRSIINSDRGRLQTFAIIKGPTQASALRLIFVLRSSIRAMLFFIGAALSVNGDKNKESGSDWLKKSILHFKAVLVLIKVLNPNPQS